MNPRLLTDSPLTVFTPMTTTPAITKIDRRAFHAAMRTIWQDHLTWTRFIMIGVFQELPELATWRRLLSLSAFEDVSNLDPTNQRLPQTRENIGDAIRPFYGEAVGEQLTAFFTDHLLIAVEILQATKSKDVAAHGVAIERWYANADKLASFLNTANPNHWRIEELRARLKRHLDLTLSQAVAYLVDDHGASAAAYNDVHTQALEIANMLSEGIIQQFPDQFSD